MSEYSEFTAEVVPMAWGDNTYTVIPVPDEIDAALRGEGAKRGEGEINDHPVNLALSRAPVIDGTFLWAGRSLLVAAGIEPGEEIFVRRRPADPDYVEMPSDLDAALRARDASAAWMSLSPGKRRAAIYQIETAKRADTRAKRIAAVIEQLT